MPQADGASNRGGERPGAGRKRIPIDPEQVARLRALGCTIEEIAGILRVQLRTLQNRLRSPQMKEAFEYGRANYKLSIRSHQMKQLTSGSTRMAIHLGKTVLKQSAPATSDGPQQFGKQPNLEAIDELLAIADEEKSGNGAAGPEDEGGHG